MLNILIIKLSAIGDVIHCLPVAAALKRQLPEARIWWLVEPASAELLRGNPCVDEVLVFKAKDWVKEWPNPLRWAASINEASAFFGELRRQKFDAVLEMQGLLKSALLTLASGAKIRMGFADTREFADRFLSHKVDVGDYFGHYVPVVNINLKVAQSLLQLLGKETGPLAAEFCLPPVSTQARNKIDQLLSDLYIRNEETAPVGSLHSIPAPRAELVLKKPSIPAAMPTALASGRQKRLCAIIPGTTWITKIWPAGKWLQLCQRLVNELDYQLVFTGSTAERALNHRLHDDLNASLGTKSSVDITAKTSLLELAALFELCDLVIGGDTGPLHLAAAVGKPKVLGIYGSTPWRRNGPFGAQCRTIALGTWCQPCYAKTCAIGTVACLTNLTVEQVFEATLELLH